MFVVVSLMVVLHVSIYCCSNLLRYFYHGVEISRSFIVTEGNVVWSYRPIYTEGGGHGCGVLLYIIFIEVLCSFKFFVLIYLASTFFGVVC